MSLNRFDPHPDAISALAASILPVLHAGGFSAGRVSPFFESINSLKQPFDVASRFAASIEFHA